MTVYILEHPKDLQTSNDMLDPQAGRSQHPVLLTFFRRQRAALGLLVRRDGVAVISPDALIPGIPDQRGLQMNLHA